MARTFLKIKAKPNSKEEKVEKTEDGSYKVWVKSPPVKGLANKDIIKVIADHLKVNKNQVNIISGRSSKNKVLKIDNLK